MIREHGTRNKYVHEQCRCADCRAANTTAERMWRRRHAHIQAGAAQPPMVDSAPTREHVLALMASGIGFKRVARMAMVATSTVGNLIYGRPGLPPPPTIRAETARRLLGITTPDPAPGALVDATGTHRRLQALVAVGWSGFAIMQQLGREPTNFGQLFQVDRVLARTASDVRELYDRIWDMPSPNHTGHHRAAAERARRYAAERGWAPPAAWDDDTIDDPATTPQGVRASAGGAS